MRTLKTLTAGFVGLAVLAATSHAALTPFGTSSDGVGGLGAVMTDMLGTSYDPTGNNRVADTGAPITDQLWTAGASAVSTLVLEVAGNAAANTFGLYNPGNTGNKLQVFAGPAGSGNTVTVYFDHTTGEAWVDSSQKVFVGNQFGFYLGGVGNTFYSQNALNSKNTSNPDGVDQMVTLQTATPRTLTPSNVQGWGGSTTPVAWNPGDYLLCWEDLPISNSDRDFQDMIVDVHGVSPVPEPTTMIAGALLLLPFGASTLRMLRKKHMA